MSARKKAFLALITTSVIWGFATPVIKYTLGVTTPAVFLYYRFLITVIIMSPFFISYTKNHPITKRDLLWYIIIGFFSVPLCLMLLFYGIRQTTAIDSTIISIISPVVIIVGGALFLKDNITKREKIGIILTFIGTVLTIIQPIFEYKNATPNLIGNVLVLVGTLAGVVATLLYKKKSNHHLNPFVLTYISFVLGLIIFLPILLTESPNTIPALAALPGIFYMALLGSVIAYTLSNYGISKIEASESALFTYLQPIFALPASVLFLHETISTAFIVGSVFVLGGVIIAETRK